MSLIKSFLSHFVSTLIFFGVLSMAHAGGEAVNERTPLNERQKIYKTLVEQGLLNKGRQLVRMVHVCNLVIDKKIYPVIEVKENVRGAQVPRGVPHVFILDSSLKYINKIYYDIGATPLYCKDNKLYWFGYLMIDDRLPEGNVVTFTQGGRKMTVSAMESNDFPSQRPPQ